MKKSACMWNKGGRTSGPTKMQGMGSSSKKPKQIQTRGMRKLNEEREGKPEGEIITGVREIGLKK